MVALTFRENHQAKVYYLQVCAKLVNIYMQYNKGHTKLNISDRPILYRNNVCWRCGNVIYNKKLLQKTA